MIIPPGFAQVNMMFAGGGLPRGAQVTFGVASQPLISPSDIATAVGNLYNQHIRPEASNQMQLEGILVKMGPNDTGPSAIGTYASVGLKIMGDVFPNVALLIRKNTLVGGRRGRGRFYWPIIADGVISNGGFIDGLTVGALQNAFASFHAGLNDGGHPMQLLHADAVTQPVPVSSLTVQGTVATQRRRLRK